MAFDQRITDVAGLRRHYAEPHPNVKAKAIDHVDEGARDFLALATFAVLATNGPRGGDASPRGGPPGSASCSTTAGWRSATCPATGGWTASRTS
jgi:predicted pyridoxine 5'-phosphate oxidase superfamily flavin-nucleotide-binding protein